MRSGKILVVEDEDQVRALIVRLLQKRGFEVTSAENGRKALDLARANLDDYAMVISDLIMPEMGGAALLRELRKLRPELPFLFMTGYTREEAMGNDGSESAHFIEKPFTPGALADEVEKILTL